MEKTGSQLTEARVFGHVVETINGTIVTKCGMQQLLMREWGITDRHARAWVNSRQAEGLTEALPGTRINLHDAVFMVGSAECEVGVRRVERNHKARVENGRKRWRIL